MNGAKRELAGEEKRGSGVVWGIDYDIDGGAAALGGVTGAQLPSAVPRLLIENKRTN